MECSRIHSRTTFEQELSKPWNHKPFQKLKIVYSMTWREEMSNTRPSILPARERIVWTFTFEMGEKAIASPA